MNIVVLDGYTLNPGDLSLADLHALGNCTVHERTPPELTVERARNAEALLTNKVMLRQAELCQLPRLRYIGVLATGYNVVDINAAKENGVVVTNIPAYSTASVAQHTMALLLELTNQVGLHSRAVLNGQWSASPDFSFRLTPLRELNGLTLGIIGCGAIGSAVAGIALALGMKVLMHSRHRPKSVPAGAEWTAERHRLFREADVLTLHCPLTEDTRNLVSAETLALMKTTAILINASRGPLVNEEDLAQALTSGRIAGAAMDVLGMEPPLPTNPLLSAPNCVITPHLAWATKAARQRLLQMAIENLASFLEGRPQNVVNT